VFSLLGFLSVMATHNRAGEITYRHTQGNTYEITITTYTKTSVLADREWLKIAWGDNLNPGAQLDSIRRDDISFDPFQDFQINTYTDFHTYPGPGIYVISVEDPNRNEGVWNIPESVVVPFYIESMLHISPLGHNNSVQLLNPAVGDACLNSIWYHNPAAFDVDGDSLVYSLIPCRGEFGNQIIGFQSPDASTPSASDTFTIDPFSGDVIWDTPQSPAGEYNFAIKIEEYRSGFLVGYVVRDMQVTVITCNNEAPEIEAIRDTCIEVGQNLQFSVQITDPNGDSFEAMAIGGPMTEVEHQANFNAVTGLFSWTPQCEELRYAPYEMVFRAEDQGNQIPLIGIESMFITVVAPAVENTTATPGVNQINLTWDENSCAASQSNPQLGAYKIYRRNGEFGFEPSECELGVPAYTGYQLIGTVNGLGNTSYLDEENLNFGGTYCYMIVTCFEDGSISYASEEFCASIQKDTPVMTNVDVNITDQFSGENYVAWSPPTAIDTLIYIGPYRYELFFNNESAAVFSSEEEQFFFDADTTFVHQGIDTESQENRYRVVFYANGTPINSNPATSIFLQIEPNDNQLTLFWDENVPWSNDLYEIFMEDEFGEMQSLGFSAQQDTTITDLINNQEYCFYVKSIGAFGGGEDIVDPVINKSQRACSKPVDLTPPCPPELGVEVDCDAEQNYLTWSNPNNSCADDVTEYQLYYAPFLGQELLPVLTFSSSGADDTSFTFNIDNDLNSIAGCFAVTALDSLINGSLGLNQNESEFSNVVCVDNCPLYFLPNIFSPNGDGVNDLFVPIKNRFVESVRCTIFNRWGSPVFTTTEANLNWDGSSNDSKEVVSDGVYYYVITANTIRLEGIVPIELSGTVTVVDADNINLIEE